VADKDKRDTPPPPPPPLKIGRAEISYGKEKLK
jgi:hypothetical protein